MPSTTEQARRAAILLKWFPRCMLEPVVKQDPILRELKKVGIEPRMPDSNVGYVSGSGDDGKVAVKKGKSGGLGLGFGFGLTGEQVGLLAGGGGDLDVKSEKEMLERAKKQREADERFVGIVLGFMAP